MSRRMYEAGSRIETIDNLVWALRRDVYCFIGHKLQHAGWVFSLQLNVILMGVSRGNFRHAVLTDYGRAIVAKRKTEFEQEIVEAEKELA